MQKPFSCPKKAFNGVISAAQGLCPLYPGRGTPEITNLWFFHYFLKEPKEFVYSL